MPSLCHIGIILSIFILSSCSSNPFEAIRSHGLQLYQNGQYQQAIEVFEATLVKLRQSKNKSLHEEASILNHIGKAQYALGNYREAVKTFTYVLNIDRQIQSEFHPKLARDYNNLAACYYALGQHHQAVELYDKSLLILRKYDNEDSVLVASVLNNLGAAWYAIGNYQKSQAYNEEALAIHLKPYSQGAFRADISKNISHHQYESPAYHYYLKNENLLSIQDHRLASSSTSETNHESPNDITWSTLDNAISWGNEKIVHKAIKHYNKVLSSHGKDAANNAQLVASDLNNLGLSYQALGNYQLALDHYKQALNLDEKTLPKDHPHIATDWINIGAALVMLKQPQKALEYFERALVSTIKTLGNKHPKIAIIYNNMGIAYRSLKNMRKSYESFQNGIALYNRGAQDNGFNENNTRRAVILTQR